jgi:hypothetical protein
MLASLKENGETQPLATLQSVVEEVKCKLWKNQAGLNKLG